MSAIGTTTVPSTTSSQDDVPLTVDNLIDNAKMMAVGFGGVGAVIGVIIILLFVCRYCRQRTSEKGRLAAITKGLEKEYTKRRRAEKEAAKKAKQEVKKAAAEEKKKVAREKEIVEELRKRRRRNNDNALDDEESLKLEEELFHLKNRHKRLEDEDDLAQQQHRSGGGDDSLGDAMVPMLPVKDGAFDSDAGSNASDDALGNSVRPGGKPRAMSRHRANSSSVGRGGTFALQFPDPILDEDEKESIPYPRLDDDPDELFVSRESRDRLRNLVPPQHPHPLGGYRGGAYAATTSDYRNRPRVGVHVPQLPITIQRETRESMWDRHHESGAVLEDERWLNHQREEYERLSRIPQMPPLAPLRRFQGVDPNQLSAWKPSSPAATCRFVSETPFSL